MTFDSGVTDGTKIYIDGFLVWTGTSTVAGQTRNFSVGASQNVGTGAWERYLDATIDEVAVYNQVLTYEDIIQHYSGGVINTMKYEKKKVGEALDEFVKQAGGFDVGFEPRDGTNGEIATMSLYPYRRGELKENCIFGWGIAPHNVQQMTRMIDMEKSANELYTTGTSGANSSLHTDEESKDRIGLYEAITSYSDLTNVAFLDALAQEEVDLRGHAKEMVTIIPQPGISPMP